LKINGVVNEKEEPESQMAGWKFFAAVVAVALGVVGAIFYTFPPSARNDAIRGDVAITACRAHREISAVLICRMSISILGAEHRYQESAYRAGRIGTRTQHIGPENRYQKPVPIFPFSSVFHS
jgi:hypothetical protein